MTTLMRSRLRALAAVTALAASAAAPACGFEDPGSLGMRRGFLNLSYPESLHVGTAVWQAQASGVLPREAVDPSLPSEARTTLAMLRANSLTQRFAGWLSADSRSGPRPGIALVVLGPMLWTRYAWNDGSLQVTYHAEGPVAGDVVLVTDLPVVDAVVAGRLTMADALESGLARLYGEPAVQQPARGWLVAADRR